MANTVQHSHTGATFTSFPPQYAESHNLLFHSATHWYQHHQSAAFLQKASYYFRSVRLFSSIDGTFHELSTHIVTLLVITTFKLDWLTVSTMTLEQMGCNLRLTLHLHTILYSMQPLGCLTAPKTYFLNHVYIISFCTTKMVVSQIFFSYFCFSVWFKHCSCSAEPECVWQHTNQCPLDKQNNLFTCLSD